MKRGQVLVLLAAVAAVAIVAVLARETGPAGGANATAPPGSLAVRFVFSPEKEKLLEPLVERFNERGEEVDGKPVFVEGRVMSSGEAEEKIGRGALEPVAWSPASSLWGRLLNFDADRRYVARRNPSIVRTPLVIAMWEPMARALGYPRRSLGFGDILRLASSRAGWGAYGKPEYGAFKLVHTNPDFSTSGLSAVVAEYYAATGKKEGLTVRDVTASRARATVRTIERSIVHYGDTTLFVAEQMRKEGPGYASAVAMEETTLVDFNRTRGPQPRLVAIYPKEGTVHSDNPFLLLDAPWVSPAEAEGARRFRRFLAEEITPELAAEFGFRSPDSREVPEPLTPENGVDPGQPKRLLDLPEPRVLDAVRRTWREDRKPANVLLVVDTSGSMIEERRLRKVKAGLRTFFREVSPDDRIGLMRFSNAARSVVPLGRFGENRPRLLSAVRRLAPGGGTAVYDATAAGFATVSRLRDRSRINAVVVLTDGEDTDSSIDVEEVVGRLRAQGDGEARVRVFTIAYSADAEGAEEALRRIAQASGGQAYTGSTEDIRAVYRSISSYF